MSSFMQPSFSKAWLWSSCRLTFWFSNGCLQRSVLLASSSPSLIITRFPPGDLALQFFHLPSLPHWDAVNLNMLSAGQNMQLGPAVLASVLWSGPTLQFRMPRAELGSRRQMENSLCGEQGREKTCIPSRISSCAKTMSLTRGENKIWQHGHEIYLKSFTHGLHLEL